jgi:hypothetical protein
MSRNGLPELNGGMVAGENDTIVGGHGTSFLFLSRFGG